MVRKKVNESGLRAILFVYSCRKSGRNTLDTDERPPSFVICLRDYGLRG